MGSKCKTWRFLPYFYFVAARGIRVSQTRLVSIVTLTFEFNGVNPVVMAILTVKIEEDLHNGLISIMFIRSKGDTHRAATAEGTMAVLLYHLCNVLCMDDKGNIPMHSHINPRLCLSKINRVHPLICQV